MALIKAAYRLTTTKITAKKTRVQQIAILTMPPTGRGLPL